MYVLYGSRYPGTETRLWEDKDLDNCKALMQLETERGTTELRIAEEMAEEPKAVPVTEVKNESGAPLTVKLGGGLINPLDPQTKAREALFMVIQEIDKEDRMVALKAEVYRTFAKAEAAAKKLTGQTGFKHFVKQI